MIILQCFCQQRLFFHMDWDLPLWLQSQFIPLSTTIVRSGTDFLPVLESRLVKRSQIFTQG